jgi:hypothetical protein
MQLTIDGSTLVAESLRVRGRQLIATPIFDLVVAAAALSEATHELEKRIVFLERHRQLSPTGASVLRSEVQHLISEELSVFAEDDYAENVGEARWRIPRDPDDVPTVALALATRCGIWTGDYDFFGCGVPVSTTETLLAYLDHQLDHQEVE